MRPTCTHIWRALGDQCTFYKEKLKERVHDTLNIRLGVVSAAVVKHSGKDEYA
jgi:hypothetical protein